MKTLNLVNSEASDIKYQVSHFPDGQQQVTLKNWYDTDKPSKVIIKSGLNNFKDLELIICAVNSLKELGVKEIHLYTPYFLGSRSDRKFEEGSNNYLKDVICPIINSLKFDSVTVMDPHSDILEACLNNFKKIDNLSLVRWGLANIQINRGNSQGINLVENCILISPDAGANKKIYKLAEQIGYKGDIITCSKSRDNEGKLSRVAVPLGTDGKFLNKDFIIIDDICDGGATFLGIAKSIRAFQGNGGKIYLIVTHSIQEAGLKKLLDYFDIIYTTNSYNSWNLDRIKVLNVF